MGTAAIILNFTAVWKVPLLGLPGPLYARCQKVLSRNILILLKHTDIISLNLICNILNHGYNLHLGAELSSSVASIEDIQWEKLL